MRSTEQGRSTRRLDKEMLTMSIEALKDEGFKKKRMGPEACLQ